MNYSPLFIDKVFLKCEIRNSGGITLFCYLKIRKEMNER